MFKKFFFSFVVQKKQKDMLSKNKIKLINSLSIKKHRDESGFFAVEGTKTVMDLSPYFSCEILCATSDWLVSNQVQANEIIEIDENELKKISNLKTPQKVLAVFKKKEIQLDVNEINNSLSLVLDNIQDPGNLGTIVRIADWFGIKNILCSLDTADVFNPKTIQATMGAIARVKVHYVHIPDFLLSLNPALTVFGTFLEGDNIYKSSLPQKGLIVMGNEGNGISDELRSFVKKKLYIPSFPQNSETSESLNVAVATAIVCSEFRRR